MAANLQTYYQNTVAPALREKLQCNAMAIPKITKITLNMGVGEATSDKKVIEHAVANMTAIAGQKPVITKAKSLGSLKARGPLPPSFLHDTAPFPS